MTLYNYFMKIDPTSIDYIFGRNLCKIREGRGMSQMEFADLCGISPAYYGRVELGMHSLTIARCYKISQALGIRLADLFEGLVE